MTVLVLNKDAQPISLLPLSTVEWQEAIRYLVLEKADVLAWYDDWIVHSAHWSTPVPAVLMLHDYQRVKTTVRLSKKNVFLRDQYMCQYCHGTVKDRDATLDHVVPVSLGGDSSWLNLTTACKPCNYRKGNNSKMKPARKPYRPEFWELVEKRRKLGFNFSHPSWAYFLQR